MSSTNEIEFGCVAAAAGAPGASDTDLYRAMLSDVELAVDLGYSAIWTLEHHFSDYFPTPSPLVALSHIAGHYPDLDLGTMVLVTPWYEPLRLAGEIAMLSMLTHGRLMMGMGRGTAKYEYDAFGLEMAHGRRRFEETAEVLACAISGDSFSYDGEQIHVEKEVAVRPTVSPGGRARIELFGAIGSPGSASVIAGLGLPPICTTIGDLETQRGIIDAWDARAAELGDETDVRKPIAINCIIEDTDEEAVVQAQTFIPRFMRAQVDHYTPDEVDWEKEPSYQGSKGQFEGMRQMTDPAAIPRWTTYQLVGSPETVGAVLDRYVDIGFNHFIVHTSTPGVPTAQRQRWIRRFAEEVAPRSTSTKSAWAA